jgi:hypothetical protein
MEYNVIDVPEIVQLTNTSLNSNLLVDFPLGFKAKVVGNCVKLFETIILDKNAPV